ncbi:KOW domain-containing RNA-binding protein [Staphylospora marina]|uniref:KOW domain-containing RNA-binding protein n=1 Tax=Staphylospora marina TaxID=2490858 RepID=UPI000F5C1060|nr:KOW domain-containing RNA-binding protein [Staphylospora marina]
MNVAETEGRPRPGQIVRILRGRDAGRFMIVVGFEEPHFVLLADGDMRKMDRPKRKNLKHIQITHTVNEEIADAINQFGRVNNARLRYALNQYLLSHEQKGE